MQLKKTNQKQTKKHLWSFRPQKVKDFKLIQIKQIKLENAIYIILIVVHL